VSGNKADLIRQIAELEGIDIEIAGYDDEVFRNYDIGSTTGKLVPAARVTTLLVTRLQSRWKIDLSAITLELPGGFNTTADVLVNTQSDLRMKELRAYRQNKLSQRASEVHGYKIWLSTELEEFLGHRLVKVTGFYVFDKCIITTTDHPSQGNVFSEVNDMRLLWLAAEAAKNHMVKDDITATLTGDLFHHNGVRYQRYISIESGK
jgi:hypothetical protein